MQYPTSFASAGAVHRTSSSAVRRPLAAPARPWVNPLRDDPLAATHASYAVPGDDGGLHLPLAPAQATNEPLQTAHQEVLQHVGDKAFPCVGAKSVFNRRRYRMGLYPALGSEAAARAVCHDLYEFSREFKAPVAELASFIAVFEPGAGSDEAAFGSARDDAEAAFESALWRQLQRMHDVDCHRFDWDEAVARDPADAGFSFSIGARGFFVVGLHPQASRLARRTPRPVLVFNLHEQFEALRQSGKYDAMRNAIRQRDLALQGDLNPVLDDHGRSSEARQYAGRAVAADWRCPFHHQGKPNG